MCSECWYFSLGVKHRNLGVCEWLLMVLALAVVILFLPLSIWFCFKVKIPPSSISLPIAAQFSMTLVWTMIVKCIGYIYLSVKVSSFIW